MSHLTRRSVIPLIAVGIAGLTFKDSAQAQRSSILPFMLGAYSQPPGMFSTWQQRGVNTFVEVPDGTDVRTWSEACEKNSFYSIRAPSDLTAFDTYCKRLVAIALPDEPDNTDGRDLSYQSVKVTPSTLLRTSEAIRGKFPNKDIWLNLVGNHIVANWSTNCAVLQDQVKNSGASWLSCDAYQIQDGNGLLLTQDGYVSTYQGIALDRLKLWSGGRPQTVFIGASDIYGNRKIPTAGQFRAMCASSIIHGAIGLIYFGIELSPWKWDGVPIELIAEMIKIKDYVKCYSMFISYNPQSPSIYRLFKCGGKEAAENISAGLLSFPFEAATFERGTSKLTMMLNLSCQDSYYNGALTKDGVHFLPYEVKFFL